MEIYTVKAGDTLTSIAAARGLSAELLQRENMLSNPESLVAGQDLIILRPEVTHTVTRGETLSAIAQRYGTTANAILKNNPTADAYALIPGEELVISYEGVNPTRRIIMNGYTYTALSYIPDHIYIWLHQQRRPHCARRHGAYRACPKLRHGSRDACVHAHRKRHIFKSAGGCTAGERGA